MGMAFATPADATAPRALAARWRRTGAAQGVVLGLAIPLLFVIVAYPMLWLVLAAFGIPGPPTVEHLARVATRAQNFDSLVNTLQLAFGTGLLSIAFGVPLAWATSRSDMPLRRSMHALVALSYITPPYLTALAYIILLGPDAGLFNRLLRWLLGLEAAPFNIFSMGGVIFVIGVHVFAFTYFLTYTALQSVDASLEESAQVLGAGRWTVIRRINLPLVAPAITGGALLSAVDSLALFGPQAILGTPARIVFLPTRIYATIGGYPPRWGETAALSLVLVLLTVLGLAIQRGYLERRSYITVGGRGVRTGRTRLGGWRWVLLAFCVTVVFFSAVAPISVLAITSLSKNWIEPPTLANLTLAHFQAALFTDQIAARGVANSFRLATSAALIAVLLGAAIAYLDVRTTLKGRRLLDYLAILPLGLPGTVIAVGILLAFIRPPFSIYGTIWILLVAYVARFIPLATRSANATFRQIDPSLEEAARITGANWLTAIRRILLPLSRPGLFVAFLLVFIPAFGELSATILLYTGGTETIAIAIYRLNDLGQLEVVSALAVFTIGVILALSLLVSLLSGPGAVAADVQAPVQRR
jgi:iron(III) transport system permease protein